jgi:anti-sigma factor RsiW
MNSLCLVDGETLSRFQDGELAPAHAREVEAHLPSCVSCTLRLGRFRLADAVVSRGRVRARSRRQTAGLVASWSVAAALVASLATNVLLTPADHTASRPGLKLAAAPSDSLTSFYEKVAPPQARP